MAPRFPRRDRLHNEVTVGSGDDDDAAGSDMRRQLRCVRHDPGIMRLRQRPRAHGVHINNPDKSVNRPQRASTLAADQPRTHDPNAKRRRLSHRPPPGSACAWLLRESSRSSTQGFAISQDTV